MEINKMKEQLRKILRDYAKEIEALYEGWIDPSQIDFSREATRAAGLMTGQEWFKRFEDELRGMVLAYGRNGEKQVLTVFAQCRDAAKKAANIKDKK